MSPYETNKSNSKLDLSIPRAEFVYLDLFACEYKLNQSAGVTFH